MKITYMLWFMKENYIVVKGAWDLFHFCNKQERQLPQAKNIDFMEDNSQVSDNTVLYFSDVLIATFCCYHRCNAPFVLKKNPNHLWQLQLGLHSYMQLNNLEFCWPSLGNLPLAAGKNLIWDIFECNYSIWIGPQGRGHNGRLQPLLWPSSRADCEISFCK